MKDEVRFNKMLFNLLSNCFSTPINSMERNELIKYIGHVILKSHGKKYEKIK